jgi:hypothetical protein
LGVKWRDFKLTTSVCLVPRLRMCGAIPPLHIVLNYILSRSENGTGKICVAFNKADVTFQIVTFKYQHDSY